VLTGLGSEALYVDPLVEHYRPRMAGEREFALQHRVVLIETGEGIPLDVSLGALPFEARVIGRSSPYGDPFACAGGIYLATGQSEVSVAENDEQTMTIVPIPGEDNEPERERIRQSNDRDQELERRGEPSTHNRGYDEAADGKAVVPAIERVVDE
jgi:hypothetical protein